MRTQGHGSGCICEISYNANRANDGVPKFASRRLSNFRCCACGICTTVARRANPMMANWREFTPVSRRIPLRCAATVCIFCNTVLRLPDAAIRVSSKTLGRSAPGALLDEPIPANHAAAHQRAVVVGLGEQGPRLAGVAPVEHFEGQPRLTRNRRQRLRPIGHATGINPALALEVHSATAEGRHSARCHSAGGPTTGRANLSLAAGHNG